jgi:hypothetical protein
VPAHCSFSGSCSSHHYRTYIVDSTSGVANRPGFTAGSRFDPEEQIPDEQCPRSETITKNALGDRADLAGFLRTWNGWAIPQMGLFRRL